MKNSYRFYGVLRGDDSEARQIEMDAQTAHQVSARFAEMRNALLPVDVQTVQYRPLASLADDDDETVFSARFDLPASLTALADKGDAVGPLQQDDLLNGDLKAVLAIEQKSEDPLYLFQGVDRRNVLKPGWALFLSKDTFRRREEPALILNDRIHAGWQDGVLFFVRESDARKVVDFASIFEPATDPQLKSFAQHDKIRCDFNWLRISATPFYRRRIAAVLSSGILSKMSMHDLQAAAKKVQLKLPVKKDEDGNVQIDFDGDKKRLRYVLQFLNEDVYSSPITETLFCAAGKTTFTPG